MNTKNNSNKTALILSAILFLLCLASLICLILPGEPNTDYVAHIYQDGILIMSIPLDGTRESEIIVIEGKNGCRNEIEVRSRSIGIRSASCPDKICVKQGFLQDSRLPITCLPNRLVIQLQPADDLPPDSADSDIITY